MGTRGLTMVIRKGKPVVAQYGQFDHYPEGQGVTALKFLRSLVSVPAQLEAFINKLDTRVRFLNDADIQARKDYLKEIGSDGKWINLDQVALYNAKFQFDSREIAANILEMIALCEDAEIVLKDATTFIADSLFCEYAYVVDFDKNTFEVYKGYNREPVPAGERFADYPIEKAEGDREQWYPCTHLITYAFDALPTEAEFIAQTTELLKEDA